MFEKDLIKGIQSEKEFAQYMIDEHGYSRYKLNNDSQYDIEMIKESPDGTTSKTYELKTDFYRETGNLAIEIGCISRAKATGLWVTEADWFVYKFPKVMFFFKPQKLKRYLATHKTGICRGGDNNNAVMLLITRYQAREIATKVLKV